MAPFGEIPSINASTPLFEKTPREGCDAEPCIPIPDSIDPDGSVQNAADRWGLRFTEENVVLVKGITKREEYVQ